MLRIDAVNIICTIINLLILFFAMKKFLFGPVEKIMKERQAEADAMLQEVTAREKHAREEKSKYQASLTLLEEEKKQVLADARIKAEEEKEKLLEDARAEAVRWKEKAAEEAEREKAELMRHAQREIVDLVADAAGKVAGSQRGEEADRALYDEFLNKAGEEK